MAPREAPRSSRQQTTLLLTSLAASSLVYLLIYRTVRLAALGPLRNLAATLLATPLLLPAALATHGPISQKTAAIILAVGVVSLRLSIPLDQICGSDDAYRYIWDGKVQLAGVNPYRHAPAARQLARLRETRIHPRIFRSDMRTVYPPLAQLWFALAYVVGHDSFWGLKLIYLLHDLAALWLLALLLRRRGHPSLQALLYAWSPLAVVQGFAGSHLDPLLVPWLLLSLLQCERHPLRAGAALGCAAMVRPLAAICGPALALRRPPREGLLTLGGFAAVAGLLLLPYASAGRGLIESLLVYAQHWRFNGFLFRPLDWAFGNAPWFRAGLYGLIGTLALGSAHLPCSRPTRALLALAGYLVLAPTVYPWYLLAPLAIAALHRGPLPLLLPALVTLSDLVFVGGRVGGPWQVPPNALLLEYGLLSLLVGWQLATHAGARAQISRVAH